MNSAKMWSTRWDSVSVTHGSLIERSLVLSLTVSYCPLLLQFPESPRSHFKTGGAASRRYRSWHSFKAHPSLQAPLRRERGGQRKVCALNTTTSRNKNHKHYLFLDRSKVHDEMDRKRDGQTHPSSHSFLQLSIYPDTMPPSSLCCTDRQQKLVFLNREGGREAGRADVCEVKCDNSLPTFTGGVLSCEVVKKRSTGPATHTARHSGAGPHCPRPPLQLLLSFS